MTDGAASFDEEAWLQRLEDALQRVGRECRTIELAEEVLWGEPGSGTDGCDLTALREFLKTHSDRFRLQGNVVTLPGGGGDSVKGATPKHAAILPLGGAAPSFEEGLWVQHVDNTLEGFGGRCSTTDLADRLLWGLPGTGTESISLRDFLRSHSRRFGLRATTAWSLRVLWREGSFPRTSADFDDDLWLVRVRKACSEQAFPGTAACLTRDLYVKLSWGDPKSQTCGRPLRDFLRAHNQHFKLDGYHVFLLKADDLVAESSSLVGTVEPAADGVGVEVEHGSFGNTSLMLSISSLRDLSVEAESDGSVDDRPDGRAVGFEQVEAVIQDLGGICSTTDLADIFLWGSAGSGTAGRSLRTLLHKNGHRVEIDGTMVYLCSSGPAGPERDDEVLACLAEAHVRAFGGTCTFRDLHMKLRWGRSPRTDHSRSLREFLMSQQDRFVLGGKPTPGSPDGRSRISVSLRNPEADFNDELWLMKVEAAILRSRGRCTTRDLYMGLGWGHPGTGTRGLILREFLSGHRRLFHLQGFWVLLQDLPCDPDPGPELDERLKRVDSAVATWGWGASSRAV